MAKFKVGDKVKVVAEEEKYFDCTGAVIEVDGSTIPYRVRHVDGVARWYYATDLGPISGPAPLKVGDKVRFASDVTAQDIRVRYFFGRFDFEVEEINQHGNISVGGRRDRFFKPERFERIVETKAAPKYPTYPDYEFAYNAETGEKVFIIKKHPTKADSYYFQHYGQGNQTSEALVIHASKLSKTKPEITKATNPCAEVLAPKVSRFKAGDKVVALSKAGCYNVTVGKTYEVTEVREGNPDKVEGKLVRVKDERGRTFGQFESRWELAKAEAKPAPKFKVGDFVEVITDRHYGNQKGDRGYITEVGEKSYDSALNISVSFKGEGAINKQRNTSNSYAESDLAHASLPSGSFIVVNRKAGKLLPASTPYLHTTQKQAETEALRLANLTGVDGEFVVFQAVASAVVPPVPVRPKAELKAL